MNISNEYYEIALKSDIGERPEQQDAIDAYIEQDKGIIALCDGMGGFEGGSIASRIAVNEFINMFKAETKPINSEFLSYAMDVVDSKISGLRNESNIRIHAGSTCVIACLEKRKLQWLSVGDSRLYIIRNGSITQMTRDHTMELQARIDYSKEKITYEEFEIAMKTKDTLCSYLGINGIEIYDISERALDLIKDDIIVLVSDGVYKSLMSEDICRLIVNSSNVESAVFNIILTAEAIAKGKNQDNTSVIICKIK